MHKGGVSTRKGDVAESSIFASDLTNKLTREQNRDAGLLFLTAWRLKGKEFKLDP